MKEQQKLNIWETKLTDRCIFINNIEELLKYIQENKLKNITIHEKFQNDSEKKCIFDQIAQKNNIELTYTDNEHPITIINWEHLEHNILINQDFFNQHKDKIKEVLKKIVIEELNNKPFSIFIPDFIIDDELVDIICSNNELSDTNFNIINTNNQHISPSNIEKMKQANLEVKRNGTKISTKYVIKYNTIKDLKKSNYLRLDFNLTNEEIENFIHINDNCIIEFNKKYDDYDELNYLNNLKKIISIISKHDKTYNIKININNRELLKQSNILNYKNINLTISNDLYQYTKEEYLKEEEQLDTLIKPIKESNLSPYEKYIAVYNIVKNFKPYKENNENKESARYLRYILNNEYMVCVGYSKLLTTLLDKVGIPAMSISVGVDTSYDQGFIKEDKPTNIEGHQRNIIKIDDDKYNIHGIFVADSTWDNNLEADLYNNSAITFNQKKEAKRLEKLTTDDLLLDFNSLDDFKQKINFYLRRKIKDSLPSKKYKMKIVEAYESLYNDITSRLALLDYNKYQEFHNKYHNLITTSINNFNTKNSELKNIDKIFSDFLTEYAIYILPLTNKKIDDDILFKAIVNSKKELNKDEIKNLNELKKQIEKTHQQRENIAFPYTYDPNNPIPNYLETKQTSKKR